MQFEIKNRWTGKVQFVAKIACAPADAASIKIGLAIRWAYESGAYLGGANLGGANLRGANLRGAYLRGAVLTDADLTDADLRGADLRGADLTDAVLGSANLGGAYLGGADLGGAYLGGADLGGADLGGAYLGGADLGGAVLGGADLTGADLTGAVLTGAVLTGVPVIPNIHQRVFEVASTPKSLDMSDWHACDTTHCRAGWVVTMAGVAGLELERKLGTAAAAAVIYFASDPAIGKVPNFYCANETALADMKRCADKEAAASVAS